MRDMASEFLGHKVEDCVITCSPEFTENQRETLAYAAEKAGLDVIRPVEYPMAALIAYKLERERSKIKDYLVCDFGGSSSSVTLL